MSTRHRKGQVPAPCVSDGRPATSTAPDGGGASSLARSGGSGAARWTAWAAATAAAAAMTGCGSTDRSDGAGAATPASTSTSASASSAPTGDQPDASAVLNDADGRKVATVVFDDLDGKTWVTLDLVGDSSVAAGFHGLHIHANNLPVGGTGCLADKAQPSATWFVSADGHFATEGQSHTKTSKSGNAGDRIACGLITAA